MGTRTGEGFWTGCGRSVSRDDYGERLARLRLYPRWFDVVCGRAVVVAIASRVRTTQKNSFVTDPRTPSQIDV